MLKYLRFSVREVLLLMVACAVALAWWSDHQKLTSKQLYNSELNLRRSHVNRVLKFSGGHEHWKSNLIIQQSLPMNGGSESIPSRDNKATLSTRQDLVFRKKSEELPREVLKTLTENLP